MNSKREDEIPITIAIQFNNIVLFTTSQIKTT